MKLKIPPEIQIGAHTLRVRGSERALQVADLCGQMNLPEGIIRLSFSLDGVTRINTQVFETFIHEVIHAVDHLYVKDLEEKQVGALASGLTQALPSMGIEPDFSEIPEEDIKEVKDD